MPAVFLGTNVPNRSVMGCWGLPEIVDSEISDCRPRPENRASLSDRDFHEDADPQNSQLLNPKPVQ